MLSTLFFRVVTSNTRMLSRRWISSREAQTLLNLAPSYTMKQLREAYFTAAKKCHPDVSATQKGTTSDAPSLDTAEQFRAITEAYERLQSGVKDSDMDCALPHDEQMAFRAACESILGVPAEIVEECKRDPKFRHWLGGNTDAAVFWRNFFAVHGGLAPILDERAVLLLESNPAVFKARRKRAPRR